MHEGIQARRRYLKMRNNRSQQIIVRVFNGREVVLAVGHWCSGCEEVKSDLMGISQSPRFPLILIQSPNHVATHLILLTQPLLIHPTRPTLAPATRVIFVMSFSGDD